MRELPNITPETLVFLEWLSGTAWVLRNEQLVAIWCNDAYAQLAKTTREKVIGTDLTDVIPLQAARDREASYIRAMETQKPIRSIQFSADDRMLSILFPINERAFGHKGVLCMLQEDPAITDIDPLEIDVILESPVLDKLAALSTAELRVLYHLACGRTTFEISKQLFRSTKTIENHIASIHNKIGTKSRGELVQFASGRGLKKYSPEEWEAIITNPVTKHYIPSKQQDPPNETV